MIVNNVLVENVDNNKATAPMIADCRKIANTAPWNDHVGPCAMMSLRSESIASCVQPRASAHDN